MPEKIGRKGKDIVRKGLDSYSWEVIGEAIAPFSGATPENIEILVKKNLKSTNEMLHSITKAEVDMRLAAGDTHGAREIAEAYIDRNIEPFSNPLNIFKKDAQDGNSPYIGSHSVFGAIRDSAKFLYPEFFYGKEKGKTKLPSAKHLRKFVIVTPNHIKFYRPDINSPKNIVKNFDEITGQQPVGEVKGFSQYEIINPPFQFRFVIVVNIKGLFGRLLKDKDKFAEVVYQGVNHGLGGRRSAGYGAWRIISFKEI